MSGQQTASLVISKFKTLVDSGELIFKSYLTGDLEAYAKSEPLGYLSEVLNLIKTGAITDDKLLAAKMLLRQTLLDRQKLQKFEKTQLQSFVFIILDTCIDLSQNPASDVDGERMSTFISLMLDIHRGFPKKSSWDFIDEKVLSIIQEPENPKKPGVLCVVLQLLGKEVKISQKLYHEAEAYLQKVLESGPIDELKQVLRSVLSRFSASPLLKKHFDAILKAIPQLFDKLDENLIQMLESLQDGLFEDNRVVKKNYSSIFSQVLSWVQTLMVQIHQKYGVNAIFGCLKIAISVITAGKGEMVKTLPWDHFFALLKQALTMIPLNVIAEDAADGDIDIAEFQLTLEELFHKIIEIEDASIMDKLLQQFQNDSPNEKHAFVFTTYSLPKCYFEKHRGTDEENEWVEGKCAINKVISIMIDIAKDNLHSLKFAALKNLYSYVLSAQNSFFPEFADQLLNTMAEFCYDGADIDSKVLSLFITKAALQWSEKQDLKKQLLSKDQVLKAIEAGKSVLMASKGGMVICRAISLLLRSKLTQVEFDGEELLQIYLYMEEQLKANIDTTNRSRTAYFSLCCNLLTLIGDHVKKEEKKELMVQSLQKIINGELIQTDLLNCVASFSSLFPGDLNLLTDSEIKVIFLELENKGGVYDGNPEEEYYIEFTHEDVSDKLPKESEKDTFSVANAILLTKFPSEALGHYAARISRIIIKLLKPTVHSNSSQAFKELLDVQQNLQAYLKQLDESNSGSKAVQNFEEFFNKLSNAIAHSLVLSDEGAAIFGLYVSFVEENMTKLADKTNRLCDVFDAGHKAFSEYIDNMFVDEDEDDENEDEDEDDDNDDDGERGMGKFEKLIFGKNKSSKGRRGAADEDDDADDSLDDDVDDDCLAGEIGEFTDEGTEKFLVSLSKLAGLVCRVNPAEASKDIHIIVKNLKKDFTSEDDSLARLALMTLVEIFTHLPSKNIPSTVLELASKFYDLSSNESLEVKAACILGFGVFAQANPAIFQKVASKCVNRIYEIAKQLQAEDADLATQQLLKDNICLSIAKILSASKTHIPAQFIPNWLDSIPTSNNVKKTQEQIEEFIKILTSKEHREYVLGEQNQNLQKVKNAIERAVNAEAVTRTLRSQLDSVRSLLPN